MRVRDVVKLLIPPVFLKIRQWLVEKQVELVDSPLPQIEHHSDKMIIIGNGPSLNDSVTKYKDEILSNDRIAVNFFASSELYEVLKPNIYVFADPAFFDIPDNQKESIERLFNNITDKTNWQMRIIIPITAKDSILVDRLKSNKTLEIDYYLNYYQKCYRITKFQAWDKNLIGPPAQNVLNVALYLALFWGFKETYLIGADSSFLEDLRVDQQTNELFTIDTHFYNNNKVYSDKKLFDVKRGRVRSDWKLHDLIYAHGRMFEYYSDLREYADYKGLKIYNASEYSWINVFERKKLR